MGSVKKKKTRKKKKSKPRGSVRSQKKQSSKGKESGQDLFNQVIKMTGIPTKTIRRELKSILDRKNIDLNQLTLDQLRCAVATYLREIMIGVLERKSPQS